MPDLTRRRSLALLILFFLAGDLRAVLTDNRFGETDTTYDDAVSLQLAVQADSLRGFGRWMAESRKGPLAGLLVAGMDAVVGDPLLAARLLGVLLHGILLGMLYAFSVRLTSSRLAGLWGVFLAGTFCGIYGWFRLDFHDSLNAVLVLWALMLMLRSLEAPNNIRTALLLGLCAGLGLMSKISFPIFVLAPGAWWAISLLRRKEWRTVLVSASVCALLCAPWLVMIRHILVDHFVDSLRVVPWAERIDVYFFGVHGALYYMLAALVGAALAWRLKVSHPGAVLVLLSSVVGALALLLLVFFPWSRYLVPAFAPMILLMVLGLTGIARAARQRFSPSLVFISAGVLAAALLGKYIHDNLRGVPCTVDEREHCSGMLTPDTRPYNGFPHSLAHVKRLGHDAMLLPLDWFGMCRGSAIPPFTVWQRRGHDLSLLPGPPRHGRPFYVILCSREPKVLDDLAHATPKEWEASLHKDLLKMRKKLVATREDPDGRYYSVVKVWP